MKKRLCLSVKTGDFLCMRPAAVGCSTIFKLQSYYYTLLIADLTKPTAQICQKFSYISSLFAVFMLFYASTPLKTIKWHRGRLKKAWVVYFFARCHFPNRFPIYYVPLTPASSLPLFK
jgi:hypothetical protein